ncbi:NADP-dependent oxidoreductase domain-containing protein [Hyaloraphidium curvatum]|nr:NADP-dependent oxidoreductase domain-containing protein [Hyaloraphidium curvatum]
MVRMLPFADISVPAPGFGGMSLSSVWGKAEDAESLALLMRAVEIGCTFWDTAAIYGSGHNEKLIGAFFKENPGARDKVFVASKCGFVVDFSGTGTRPAQVTNSKEHIEEYIEGSIERLGTKPDLYYLHRIEPGRDLNESIGALDGIRKKGRCKYIGLSECSAETLRKACKIAKIDALQIEYSPWYIDHERNDLLKAARDNGVAVIAYSPLGKGVLTGTFASPSDFPEGDLRRNTPRFQGENFAANMRLVEGIKAMAEKKGCTPGQLALAWVMAQGAIPIPGTRRVARMEENFAAGEVELSDGDLGELRKLIDEAEPVGARYPEAMMKMVGN